MARAKMDISDEAYKLAMIAATLQGPENKGELSWEDAADWALALVHACEKVLDDEFDAEYLERKSIR
jgi:hypothetical protein